uniref:Transmembrane protein n=1 Tax=Macrostomum lignano TaxID=282301 RepID=A0A1I8F9W4_9PLAT
KFIRETTRENSPTQTAHGVADQPALEVENLLAEPRASMQTQRSVERAKSRRTVHDDRRCEALGRPQSRAVTWRQSGLGSQRRQSDTPSARSEQLENSRLDDKVDTEDVSQNAELKISRPLCASWSIMYCLFLVVIWHS